MCLSAALALAGSGCIHTTEAGEPTPAPGGGPAVAVLTCSDLATLYEAALESGSQGIYSYVVDHYTRAPDEQRYKREGRRKTKIPSKAAAGPMEIDSKASLKSYIEDFVRARLDSIDVTVHGTFAYGPLGPTGAPSGPSTKCAIFWTLSGTLKAAYAPNYKDARGRLTSTATPIELWGVSELRINEEGKIEQERIYGDDEWLGSPDLPCRRDQDLGGAKDPYCYFKK